LNEFIKFLWREQMGVNQVVESLFGVRDGSDDEVLDLLDGLERVAEVYLVVGELILLLVLN
jgi:hypothetical protein